MKAKSSYGDKVLKSDSDPLYNKPIPDGAQGARNEHVRRSVDPGKQMHDGLKGSTSSAHKNMGMKAPKLGWGQHS